MGITQGAEQHQLYGYMKILLRVRRRSLCPGDTGKVRKPRTEFLYNGIVVRDGGMEGWTGWDGNRDVWQGKLGPVGVRSESRFSLTLTG